MNYKTISQKNVWLICLSLILSVLAPMRALALPVASIAVAECETSTPVKMDCCKTQQECCCSAAPLEPNTLESAAQPGQSTKLIPVKTAAKPIPLHWNNALLSLPLTRAHYQSLTAMADPLPLYLLKRSLLI